MTALVCALLLVSAQDAATVGPMARLAPFGTKFTAPQGGSEFTVTLNADAQLSEQEVTLNPGGISLKLTRPDYLDGELTATLTLTAGERNLSGLRVDCARLLETYTDVNGASQTRLQTPNQGSPLFLGDLGAGKSVRTKLSTRGMSFSPETQSVEVTFTLSGYRFEKEIPAGPADRYLALVLDPSGRLLRTSQKGLLPLDLETGTLGTLRPFEDLRGAVLDARGMWSLASDKRLERRDPAGALVKSYDGSTTGPDPLSRGLKFDGKGNLYAVSEDANGIGQGVVRINLSGVRQGYIPLSQLGGFTVDSDGSLFATTPNQVFKAAGPQGFAPLIGAGQKLAELQGPQAVKIDWLTGRLVVADRSQVAVFDRNGAFGTAFPHGIERPIEDIATFADGRIALLIGGEASTTVRLYSRF